MSAKRDDFMMKTWKQQFSGALQVVVAITEEARRMQELQLAAAVEAHASAVATRARLESAVDTQELWRIQSEWWAANLNRSLAYLREACAAAGRTQACLARGMGAPTSAEGSSPSTATAESGAADARKAA